MNPENAMPAYGLWSLVLLNSAVFMLKHQEQKTK